MSHAVTVTRTTTTTTTTAILLNTGYMKSLTGILKACQLIVGAVCVGIIGYYSDSWYGFRYRELFVPELYFLLIATTCLIATFCLLLSCILSISTASIISKTLFEVIYHAVAFLLYLAAALTLLIEVIKTKDYNYKLPYYEAKISAAVLGLINTGLYLFSLVLALRTYRG